MSAFAFVYAFQRLEDFASDANTAAVRKSGRDAIIVGHRSRTLQVPHAHQPCDNTCAPLFCTFCVCVSV